MQTYQETNENSANPAKTKHQKQVTTIGENSSTSSANASKKYETCNSINIDDESKVNARSDYFKKGSKMKSLFTLQQKSG